MRFHSGVITAPQLAANAISPVGTKRTWRGGLTMSAVERIVLQKFQNALPLIFRERIK
jgi:hypothetical protein